MPDRRLERCILGGQAAPTLPKNLKLKKIGKPSRLVPHCKFYFAALNSSQGNCNILGKLNLQRLTVRRLGLFMYRSIPKLPIPPGQTPGHLTFLKNLGQIPRYVAGFDGQMPHPLELQRGSNPPPSRHVKQTVETSSALRISCSACLRSTL